MGVMQNQIIAPVTSSGREQISVQGVSKSLTPPSTAMEAIVQVVGDPSLSNSSVAIAFRMDGTDPTASATGGFILGKFDFIRLRNRAEIDNFRMIQAEGGITITVEVQYFKRIA